MKISTRGRYALSFMIDLAQQGRSGYIPLKDISERQGISIKYLEQITALLSKFGLLQSIRGPQGGYRLAKDSSEYTVGEILRTTEGNLEPVDYSEDDAASSEQTINTATAKMWAGLGEVVNEYLDSITLDSLVYNSGTQDYVI